MNTYGYVGGDPTNYVDPLGLARRRYDIAEHTLVCTSNDDSRTASGSNGVGSGLNDCENEPSYSGEKDKGPVPPGTHNMFPNELPGRDGWWALQSQNWIPNVSGALCNQGFARYRFKLHLGGYSLGCITFQKSNFSAVDSFNEISDILRADAPDNVLEVYLRASCRDTRRGRRCN